LYHPDEGYLVMPALRILQTGDPNTHAFSYGTTHFYLLSLLYALYFLYRARMGLWTTVADIPVFEHSAALISYPVPGVFLVGRLLTALLSTLTVLMVYVLGRRIWSERTGLLAAGLLAVFPMAVLDAHFVTTDSPATLMALVTAYAAWRIVETGESWLYMATGLLAGLAASTKYAVLPIALLVPLAHALRQQTPFWHRHLLLGVLAIPMGFLLGTPYALLSAPEFLNTLAYVIRQYARPGEITVTSNALAWHMSFWLKGFNAPVLILGVLGALWTMVRQPRKGFFLLTFPLVLWSLIAQQVTVYARSGLPTMPFFALFAAALLVHGPLNRGHFKCMALMTLVIVVLVIMFIGSTYHDILLTQEDVHTKALKWVQANIQPGTAIAVDRLGLPVPPDVWPIVRTLHLGDHDTDWYRAQGVRYLIASPMAESPNRTVQQDQAFAQLRAEATLVATIQGPFLGWPDYHFWVFHLE